MSKPYKKSVQVTFTVDGHTFVAGLNLPVPTELWEDGASTDKWDHVTSEIERLFSGWIKSQLEKNPPTE